MYAVVGCGECEALWILDGRPETSQCPRCRKRHRTDRLKRFVETEDADHAREVRASMLASRQGDGDAFAALDSFAELEAHVGDGVVDDETYLEAAGIDAEEVAAAGERAGSDGGSGDRRSRREVVLDAIRDQDDPGEGAVIAYADEHGVPADYTRRALEKLRRAGDVTLRDGAYRLL